MRSTSLPEMGCTGPLQGETVTPFGLKDSRADCANPSHPPTRKSFVAALGQCDGPIRSAAFSIPKMAEENGASSFFTMKTGCESS